MSLLPSPALVEEVYKDKLRNQMHHDLCLLSAGSAMSGRTLDDVAERAMLLYKKLWTQVMKEIP